MRKIHKFKSSSQANVLYANVSSGETYKLYLQVVCHIILNGVVGFEICRKSEASVIDGLLAVLFCHFAVSSDHPDFHSLQEMEAARRSLLRKTYYMSDEVPSATHLYFKENFHFQDLLLSPLYFSLDCSPFLVLLFFCSRC